MARKRRVHKTSPKTPSRVKKRTRRRRARSHHHAELIGLALVALGVFLAAILWFGFNGGPVSGLVTGAIGAAAYLAPVVLVPVGALVVARSRLVDVRPFQLGLGVALAGLLLMLGDAHGGAVGRALESVVAIGLGTTGATILGVLLTIAGLLLLTGASLGAIVRRTGHAVQLAHTRVRAAKLTLEPAPREAVRAPAGTAGRRQARLPRPRLRLDLRSAADARPRRAGRARFDRPRRTARRRCSTHRPLLAPTTSFRTGRCYGSRSRAPARTGKRDSASPRRSSRASRISVSRRR